MARTRRKRKTRVNLSIDPCASNVINQSHARWEAYAERRREAWRCEAKQNADALRHIHNHFMR